MENGNDLRRILADNIQMKRQKLGLTKQKLAALANISATYLSDISSCRTWVSDKTLNSLAKALNVPPYELLIPAVEAEKSKITKNIDCEHRNNGYFSYLTKQIDVEKREITHFVSEKMKELLINLLKEGGL